MPKKYESTKNDNNDFKKELNNIISEAKELNLFTRIELSKASNVSLSMISKMTGPAYEGFPSPDTIKSLAVAIDMLTQGIGKNRSKFNYHVIYKRLMDAIGYSIEANAFKQLTSSRLGEINILQSWACSYMLDKYKTVEKMSVENRGPFDLKFTVTTNDGDTYTVAFDTFICTTPVQHPRTFLIERLKRIEKATNDNMKVFLLTNSKLNFAGWQGVSDEKFNPNVNLLIFHPTKPIEPIACPFADKLMAGVDY